LKRFLTLCFIVDYALLFGSGTYFTAFAAGELFQGLPIETAGQAVGLLFPTFFLLASISSVVGVILYFMLYSIPVRKNRWMRTGRVFTLLTAIIALLNEFYLLPTIIHIEKQMGPISSAAPTMISKFLMYHVTSMILESLSLVFVLISFIALTYGMLEREADR